MNTMREKLAAIAARRGVRDPIHINAWTEDDRGEPRSDPGRQVEIRYHRADGKPRKRRGSGK